MRVVLFGTGAMSCLFAARLARVARVTLVGTWTEAITAMQDRGILYEDQQESRTVPIGATYLGAPVKPVDLAIVLVKTWQTRRVADCLSSYLTPEGLAISLQNGLGNLDLLGPRVFPGATAEGATLLGPGHVRAGGAGPTYAVAPEWVVNLLCSAGFESYRCSPVEAESLIWGKLAINCGINALTALLRIPNGELLLNPNAADLMVRAAGECAAVAQAKGIRLPFPDPASRVREVAERTAENRSSMLQDILRGTPTECDAINGAVVAEGRRVGVPTPVNEVLWKLIQASAKR